MSEDKIDSLLEYLAEAKNERKKDRILSKIDSLYNVLIALVTFSLGVLISQREIIFRGYFNALSLFVIGAILTLIISYIIGLNAMIKDSFNQRILSWTLFVLSLIYLSLQCCSSIVIQVFGPSLFTYITSFIIIIISFFLPKKCYNLIFQRFVSIFGLKDIQKDYPSKRTENLDFKHSIIRILMNSESQATMISLGIYCFTTLITFMTGKPF